ncbi:oxygenase MpaB family protein [Nocardia sp. CA-128927]|uniref:oxygenase MpaB family protein n=1 Tax=Nocardia sp. CA-128927 TaxID=3239975 RepID=UPI003D9740D7
MTCPMGHQMASAVSMTSQRPSAVNDIPAGGVAERFERFGGSVFAGLFAAALFDQAMLPEVSAALENTGRIRNAPWDRALRTAASEQIAFAAEDLDRRAEMQRLKQLHRAVKGVGYNGVRYSALNPESWNWIMISTFFMHLGGYLAVTGEQLDDDQKQAAWDHYRDMTDELQLPGRSRLVESYPELCAYYDRMVAEKLETNITVQNVVDFLRRPSPPTFLPAAATPVWAAVGPLAGYLGFVLGFGVMRPGARAVAPFDGRAATTSNSPS